MSGLVLSHSVLIPFFFHFGLAWQSQSDLSTFTAHCFSITELNEMERKIAVFMSQLKRRGLLNSAQDTELVVQYLRQLLSVTAASDSSGAWIEYAKRGNFLDDHLFMAGIALTKLRPNVVVLGPNTAQQLAGRASRRERGLQEYDTCRNVSNTIIRGWKNKEEGITVIVPINVTQAHWGAVYAVGKRAREEKSIVYWGDSLNTDAPKHVLEVVREVLEGCDGGGKWDIESSKNFMTDSLQYRVQNDIFSCGFYVLCSLGEFAEKSSLPARTYRSSGAELTEDIRERCVEKIINTVLEAAKENTGSNAITDKEVYSRLALHLVGQEVRGTEVGLGVVINLEEESSSDARALEISRNMEEGKCKSGASIGSVIVYEDVGNRLEVFVRDLEAGGERFGSVTSKCTALRKVFTVSVRLRCVEWRRSVSKCRCAILAQRHRQGGHWRVEKKGFHSHLPNPLRSLRHSFVMAHLKMEDSKNNYVAKTSGAREAMAPIKSQNEQTASPAVVAEAVTESLVHGAKGRNMAMWTRCNALVIQIELAAISQRREVGRAWEKLLERTLAQIARRESLPSMGTEVRPLFYRELDIECSAEIGQQEGAPSEIRESKEDKKRKLTKGNLQSRAVARHGEAKGGPSKCSHSNKTELKGSSSH